MRDSYYLRVLTHFPQHNVRPTLARDLYNIFLSRIRKKVRFIATTFCISHFLICDTFHTQRISFIQKVHCITSTKYLFIYTYSIRTTTLVKILGTLTQQLVKLRHLPSPLPPGAVLTLLTLPGERGTAEIAPYNNIPKLLQRQNMS